ncbi:hypothetical protein K4F52_002602 [Lecanicillium sp. MT-2017a]|nr:hypothetical protein K4F52_002602 [Lecanicillium sp. MT-2017a]
MASNQELNTSSQLQVGLELEFLAPRNKEWETKNISRLTRLDQRLEHKMREDACRHRLAEKLYESGIRSAVHLVTPFEYNDKPISSPFLVGVTRDSLVCQRIKILGDPALIDRSVSSWAQPYQHWLIKDEDSLSFEHDDDDGWIMCELNSPIINEQHTGGNGHMAGLDVVLNRIATADRHAKVHLNNGCGLHVHVSPVAGPTLLYAKRLSTLLMAVERTLLFRVCNSSRAEVHDAIKDSRSLSAMGFSFDHGRQTMPQEAIDNVPENMRHSSREDIFVHRVWSARDLVDLANKVECSRESTHHDLVPAVLFKFMPHAGGSRTMTIEFRHPEATWNVAFIRNWVRLVLAVSRVALLPSHKLKEALHELFELVPGFHEQDPDIETIWIKQLRILNEYYLAAGGQEPLDEAFWVQRVASLRHATGSLDYNEQGELKI